MLLRGVRIKEYQSRFKLNCDFPHPTTQRVSLYNRSKSKVAGKIKILIEWLFRSPDSNISNDIWSEMIIFNAYLHIKPYIF